MVHKVRMRLLITLPVFFIQLTFTSGILGAYLIKLAFLPRLIEMSVPGAQSLLLWTSVPVAGIPVEAWVGLFALFTGLVGFLLARGIVSPLQQQAEEAEAIMKKLQLSPLTQPAPNEAFLFANLFDRTLACLNRFIRDHQIIENLPEGIFSLNAEGKIITMNRVGGEIFGVDVHAAPGLSYRNLLPDVPANDSFSRLVQDCLTEKKGCLLEKVSLTFTDGRSGSFWVKVSLLSKDDGGVAVTFKDLIEVEKIRTDLASVDYLASLGAMATGMAHEIRNPLSSIRGFAELLKRDLPAEDDRKFHLEKIAEETDRLSLLVDELLDFARPSPTHAQILSLKTLLSPALNALRQNLKDKEVKIVENLQADPSIKADRVKLTLAFTNLLNNAFEAVNPGGSVSLSVQEKPPSLVSIQIANTGSYISDEERTKIFQPFYTTKSKGVGLGLAIAQRVVSAHGGEIKVESNPENGTVFTIELPTQATEPG